MTATAPPRNQLDEGRALAARIHHTGEELRAQAARRIVGLDDVIEQVLITVLTRSHALLEGVPGLAKTLLLSTVAELLDLEFSRIQFTPDLMPSDVTGSVADEINRTPPKTQAALLEAMQERQVTSLGGRGTSARARTVLRARDAEPDRAGGHVSAPRWLKWTGSCSSCRMDYPNRAGSRRKSPSRG